MEAQASMKVESPAKNTGEYAKEESKKQYTVKVSQSKDKIFEEKKYKNGVVKKSLVGMIKNGVIQWTKGVDASVLKGFKVK